MSSVPARVLALGTSRRTIRRCGTLTRSNARPVPTSPGKISAGTSSDQVLATIDLLPTIAKIAGASPPNDRMIDGLDISTIIHGLETTLKRPYFYYQHRELRAVRLGKWKIHLPHNPDSEALSYTSWPRHSAPEDRALFDENTLYNLEEDIGETTDVADDNPEIVAKLLSQLAWAKKDIGDYESRGENARPLGDEPYFTPNELIPVNE